jgi:hypothetical protein
LRALGFDSSAIVASMLLESVMLALPGALLGALAAWVLFNGFLCEPVRDELPAGGDAIPRTAGSGVGTGDGADQRLAARRASFARAGDGGPASVVSGAVDRIVIAGGGRNGFRA